MAIMTGAPVPEGADLVIPIEWTSGSDAPRGEETRVSIDRTAPAGSNIARRGGQAREGDVVAKAGSRVTPALIGALAAAGRATIDVAAPPRVEILATGDELVPMGTRPGPSQIRDSNGHALLAQTTAAGGIGIYRGPIGDDGVHLRAAISAALSADLVLLTGGVSVGEKDLVPGVLEDLGVERLFHKWAVKPGGPLWFGRKGATLVFGLPGNPAAAFVGFEVLVAPAIGARLGRTFAPRSLLRARPTSPLPAPISRRQYVPVAVDLSMAPATATPVPWSGSGDPFGLARAHGLAVVPGAGEAVEARGDGLVDVLPALAAGLGGAS
jgi:molybdopterin molybdotransferase